MKKNDSEKVGDPPVKDFAQRLLAWHSVHGRHDLPWQHPRTPYRVWVAEVMLQQTQVQTVIPYFARFMARFADVEALAAADVSEVLALWSGLGYYARGRNLHRAAQQIVAEGGFPMDRLGWEALSGIGRSTAAAIVAQAYGQREAILDGNVKRVLCRLFGVEGWAGERAVSERLWMLAEQLLPAECELMPDYTQAQMDLGATVCTRSRPRCEVCPFEKDCVAVQQNRVSELPTPRPRKALPVREVMWQICVNDDRVWLVERDQGGLWGGLHVFAQVETPRGVPLPPFRHTFTHFHLDIAPYLWHTHLPNPTPDTGAWWPLQEALALPLPAPVKKLLMEVQDES
ncbi:A/G-specific DNA-adenine glycosylase [Sulfurivirga caldicuralii]|uniref:Adenine DNA glycosylase n=1 Tax=Sulfurivirga caldicuralii TaxID=364032 RepID=A0A1N6DGJ9_9GAMM|nr:A/G-specific adenine glycosylase [Sulfurivirga caldicuralii]SIN69910.1 A/G-specific DNA-adenine glycosylase [Sulfurivirga caldicuralii]